MPTLSRPSFSLHYEDTGPRDGAPVVLMHSLLCDTTMWAHLAPSLAARYRVLNVDLRGHGKTLIGRRFSLEDLAEDVVALLDSLGLQRAALVGLSQGGMAALRMSLAHPSRVNAMCIMSSSADPERPPVRVKYLAMALSARLFGVTEGLAAKVKPLMFSDGFLVAEPEAAARAAAGWAAMDRAGIFFGTYAVAMRGDVSKRLGEIRAPTLVVEGGHDRSLPAPRSRRIADGIAGAELVTVPGAGHLSTIEQPVETTRLVEAFLARHLPPPPARP